MAHTESDAGDRSPKRRRLNDSAPAPTTGQQSPVRESSPPRSAEELAATSDYEMEHSWSAKKERSPSRRQHESHSKSPSGSRSPERFMATGSFRREQSPAAKKGAAQPTEMNEQDTHSDVRMEAEPLTSPPIESNGNADLRANCVERTDRIPTPDAATAPPPPPPPKPDHVNYVQKHVLRGHRRGVSAVKFSPDRTMIASGGADGALKVWDTSTGKLLHTFEGHLAGISTVAWSPDNETVATGSDDKTIRLWNALTGKAHPRAFSGHHNYVYSIAFSPKGNIIVSGSYDEAVFLWDVRSARVMRSLPAHSDPVAGVDICHDGTLIVSCSSDGLIRIWDTMTGQCLRTLVHDDNPPVMAVRFSPNSKYVLAWTLDDCVRLWDYVQGRCIKTYQGHINRKYSLCGCFGVYATPGGPPHAFAVSGSEDGALICWDVVGKNTLQRIEGHTDVVLCVDAAELEGKSLIVSCGLDQTVRVWEEVDNVKTEDPVKVNGEVNGVSTGDSAEITPVQAAEPHHKSNSDEAQNGFKAANGVSDDKMIS